MSTGTKNCTTGAVMSETDIRFLRVTAVVMIFACHLFERYGSAIAWWLNAGVQVFLFISGYLFGGRTIRNWREWYARRLTRVLLPYTLLILLVALGNVVMGGTKGLGRPLLASLLCMQDFFKICLPGCDHLWFIPLILICYLMVPGLQGLRERTAGKAGASAFCFAMLPVVFYLLYKTFAFLTYAYVANLAAFAWGYYFGGSRARLDASPVRGAMVTIIVGLAMASLAGRGLTEYFGLTGSAPWRGIYDKILLPWSKVGFSVTLFLALAGKRREIGAGPVTGFIDRYSYEIYLTHHVFIFGPFSLIPLFSGKFEAIVAIGLATVLAAVILRRLVGAVRAVFLPGNPKGLREAVEISRP